MKELYNSINRVRFEVTKIHKGGDNPFTNKAYATLNDCWDAIGTKLEDNNLCLVQTVDYSKKYPCLLTRLAHIETSEYIESEVPLIGAVSMQQLGGAITYARRYSLVTILGLLSADDDGNIANGRVK